MLKSSQQENSAAIVENYKLEKKETKVAFGTAFRVGTANLSEIITDIYRYGTISC